MDRVKKFVKKDIVIDSLLLVLLIIVFFYPVFKDGLLISNADFLFNWAPWSSVRPEDYAGPSNSILTDSVDFVTPAAQDVSQTNPIKVIFNDYEDHIEWGGPNTSIIGSHFHLNIGFILLAQIFQVKYLLTFYILLKVFFAGFGIYLLTREMKIHRGVRIFAAVTYMFATTNVGILVNGDFHFVYTVAPFMLYATYRLFKRGFEIRSVVLYLIASFLVFAGGFPAMVFYVFLYAGFFYGFLAIFKKGASWRSKFIQLGKFAGLNFLFILLISFALLPNFESYQNYYLDYRENFGMSTAQIHTFWNIFYPRICGDHNMTTWICSANFTETMMHAGLIPMVVIAASLLFWKKLRNEKLFFTLALLLNIMIIFNFLGATEIVSKLPIVNISPSRRTVMLIPLLISVLSAISLQNLIKYNFFRSIKVYWSLAFVMLLAFLASFRLDQLFESFIENFSILTSNYPDLIYRDIQVILGTLVIFSFTILSYLYFKERGRKKFAQYALLSLFVAQFIALFYFRMGWIPYVTPENFFPITSGISYMQENLTPQERVLPIGRVFLPNMNKYYGISSLNGHYFRTEGYTENIQTLDPRMYSTGHGTMSFIDRESVLLNEDTLNLLKFNRVKFLVDHPSSIDLKFDVVEEQPHVSKYEQFEEPTTYVYVFQDDEIVDGLRLRLHPEIDIQLEGVKIMKENRGGESESLEIKEFKIFSDYADISISETSFSMGEILSVTLPQLDEPYIGIYADRDLNPDGYFENQMEGDLGLLVYNDLEETIYEKVHTEDVNIYLVSNDVANAYAYPCEEGKNECLSLLRSVESLEQFNEVFESFLPLSITKYDRGEIDIDTSGLDADSEYVVLLAENYFPGWRATNVGEGQESEATMFDALSVYYQPSQSDNPDMVSFTYINSYLPLGAAISLLSLSGFVVLYLLYRSDRGQRFISNNSTLKKWQS